VDGDHGKRKRVRRGVPVAEMELAVKNASSA